MIILIASIVYICISIVAAFILGIMLSSRAEGAADYALAILISLFWPIAAFVLVGTLVAKIAR